MCTKATLVKKEDNLNMDVGVRNRILDFVFGVEGFRTVDQEYEMAAFNYPGFKIEWDYENECLCMTATIKNVEIEDEENTYCLGDFSIDSRLFTAGEYNEEYIRIKGDAFHTKEGYYHPHIDEEIPCWGDVQPALRKALNCGRWTDVLNLIEAFLCSYNVYSPFLTIDYWE